MKNRNGGGGLSLGVYRRYLQALDWLFPAQCAGCGELGSHWCSKSQADLRRLIGPHCPSCGLPQEHSKRCASCEKREPSYNLARSFAYYEGHLRKALLNAKFRREQALGLVFAQFLLQLLSEQDLAIDAIVPVPLGKQRLKQRGYNQVDLFARPFALMQEREYRPNALLRVKETVSQIGLSSNERWQNLENAFEARSEMVKGKKILLLDDIMTTGATLTAASEALASAGAREVFALSVARAVPDNNSRVAGAEQV